MTTTETATVVDKPAVDTIVPQYFDSKRRPSLFSHEPKSEALGASGCQSSFINAQGLQIASYYWPVSVSHCSHAPALSPCYLCLPKSKNCFTLARQQAHLHESYSCTYRQVQQLRQ